MTTTQMEPLIDGHLKVCDLVDVSEAGETPAFALRPAYTLAYAERIVGMSRYWTAMQASARIDMLVRCHRVEDVTTHQVVILRDGKQYDIVQVQRPPDVRPLAMDLSLRRRADKYDVEEVVAK